MALIIKTKWVRFPIYLPLVLIGLLTCRSEASDEHLFEEGKYEEAVAYYSEKIRSSGNDLSAHYNRGRAFEELGKLDEASADFEYILSKDPRHLEAHLSLSKIAYRRGDYSRSAVLSGNVLKYHEGSHLAHFLLARANHQLGNVQTAMTEYDAAIALNNNFGEAYFYRGALKLTLEDATACADILRAKEAGVAGAAEAIEKYCR